MSLEFTGERVVFGQVDDDLWNEHYSRYAFATRFCANALVLDAGCGVGYGSHVLSGDAKQVVGVDLSLDAVRYAEEHYPSVNQRWLCASCTQLPFLDSTFDAVIAFEVIEHLADWPKLLLEARRLLTPTGVFMVSTPNKIVYEQTRGDAGPNPFHDHEFEYTEFRDALNTFFPHVEIILENHAACVVFESESSRARADAQFEGRSDATQANFFIAVCSLQPVNIPSFVYVPKAMKPLKHGAARLARLEEELAQRNAWLVEAQRSHAELVRLHEQQTRDLESRNNWAMELNSKVNIAGERIVALQDELQAQQRSALETADAYQAELESAYKELEARTAWALETERRLTGELQHQVEELGRSVALLDKAESTVVERTEWAQRVQRELDDVQAQIAMVRASRWFKLGRMIKLGPELGS
jgi:SAM-dependent methyltransferase